MRQIKFLIRASTDEGQTIEYEREKKQHLEAAERAYNEKRIDKETSKRKEGVVTAMFDL